MNGLPPARRVSPTLPALESDATNADAMSGEILRKNSDEFFTVDNVRKCYEGLIDHAKRGQPLSFWLRQLKEVVDSEINSQSTANGEPQQAVTLDKFRFDIDIAPPPLSPVYSLGMTSISTRGNLSTIAAQVKSGKSTVVGAVAASAMTNADDSDCFGFSSRNSDGKALLWFDSEQSPSDFWHSVKRSLKRAGLTKPPAWFHGYCLTGISPVAAWQYVHDAIRLHGAEHGGIHSILLDGVADFVADVNDAKLCNAFVAELHSLAIKHDCPIICVIHFNPGNDKTRGHLGSQLERKAETNLRLDKADSVTTIWSEKQRKAPIAQKDGPSFEWSDTAQMHVSVENPIAAKAQKKCEEDAEELATVAQAAFGARKKLSYVELVEFLVSKAGLSVSESTAKRKVKAMANIGVIVKVGKHYTLKELQ